MTASIVMGALYLTYFAVSSYMVYAYRSAHKEAVKQLDSYRRTNDELSAIVVTQDDMSQWDKLSPAGRKIWSRLYRRRDRRNGND